MKNKKISFQIFKLFQMDLIFKKNDVEFLSFYLCRAIFKIKDSLSFYLRKPVYGFSILNSKKQIS